MLNRRSLLLNVRDVVLIAIGSALTALSYALFLIPHKIVPGGVSGVAMLLHYFAKTPVGLVAIVIYVPIFFWGMRELGRMFGVKSIIGVALSSLMIDFFTYAVKLHSVTNNKILAAVYGGILLGVGLGVVFRGSGSTGGTDIVGQVLSRHSNFSAGVAIMVIDFVVISAAGLSFHSIESALYGYGTLFLSTKVIDFVLEGWSYARALFVITEQPDAVVGAITGDLGRGATRLHGQGGYTGKQLDVIYCVVTKREVQFIKRYIQGIDTKAFVVITDVYEVLGEGFKPRTQHQGPGT
jgi:uncharacterized membrane-anchored protein YitT (DUF2179 family)